MSALENLSPIWPKAGSDQFPACVQLTVANSLSLLIQSHPTAFFVACDGLQVASIFYAPSDDQDASPRSPLQWANTKYATWVYSNPLPALYSSSTSFYWSLTASPRAQAQTWPNTLIVQRNTMPGLRLVSPESPSSASHFSFLGCLLKLLVGAWDAPPLEWIWSVFLLVGGVCSCCWHCRWTPQPHTAPDGDATDSDLYQVLWDTWRGKFQPSRT